MKRKKSEDDTKNTFAICRFTLRRMIAFAPFIAIKQHKMKFLIDTNKEDTNQLD